jgi:predicted RNase H-like nuclease
MQQLERTTKRSDLVRLAGIDGCRSGWIYATSDGVNVMTRLRLDDYDLIGIDMPIGLTDDGPRRCDVEARKFLGRRGSSVFPSPPRSCLTCTDYQSAHSTARLTTGRGISVQTYNIMAKIVAIDLLITAADHHRVIEVHPECSFKMLNNNRDLPSKRTVEGQTIRRELLGEHFTGISSHPPSGAAIDDVLDAYAVLWSVRRYQRDKHHTFGDGGRDRRGIEMRIVC